MFEAGKRDETSGSSFKSEGGVGDIGEGGEKVEGDDERLKTGRIL